MASWREHRSQRKDAASSALVAVWPNLRYFSLAMLLAWQFLVVDFGAWMTATDVTNLSVIDVGMTVYMTSAVVLVLSAFAQDLFARLFDDRRAPALIALVSIAGVVLLIASGPRFLQGTGMSGMLFHGGSFLVGVGSGLMTLRVSQLYCDLEPGRVFLYAALSELLVAVIFYVVIGNSWMPSVPGGPPLLNLVAVAVLPVALTGCASLPAIDTGSASCELREGAAGGGRGKVSGPTAGTSTVRGFFRQLPMMGKLLVALFVFSAVASIVRNYFLLGQTPDGHQLNSQQAMLARFALAACLLLVAVFLSKRVSLGKLYLLCMAFMALVVATLPLLGLHAALPLAFTSALTSVIGLVAWCLLAFVAKSQGFRPFLVFGLGEGACCAGLGIGYLCGYSNLFGVLGASDQAIGAPMVAVLIVLIVACAVLVFTEKDFDSVLELSGASILNVRDAIIRGRTAATVRRNRPWRLACRRVGERAMLSKREQELLEELACNRTPQEIASRLSITVSTVRTHTHRVYLKLDVHSRDELIELVRTEYESRGGA